MAQLSEVEARIGVKHIVVCNSAWSNEQWAVFGVAEFPDLETVQKHTQALMEINWFRYIESETMLGTAWQ